MTTIPLAETGARLTIDLGAIAANYRLLAARAQGAECAAVVKADAYGLGLERVAAALWLAGARSFFTAHLFEAKRLREALPEARVYALSGLAPGAAGRFTNAGVRPVLGSLEEVREWLEAGTAAARVGAALHVDTGINRLGVSPSEAVELATESRFDPALLISHMACADTPGHPKNESQISVFYRVAQSFPETPKSLANSAATLALPGARFDMVRPGIALYGGEAVAGTDNPMRQVVRLEARVVQVRQCPPGETVGYGATCTLTRPSRIAIVSLGYADGYLRLAGDGEASPAEAAVNGRRVPLAGRVSMDLIAIDVTELGESAVKRGDMVELIGDTICLDEVAARASTIGYEVLTRLGERFERVYIEPGAGQ